MKYRTNQTEWMVQTWDAGDGGYRDYWGISTWSRSRKEATRKARRMLAYNRGASNVPRFRVVHVHDKDISALCIPVET